MRRVTELNRRTFTGRAVTANTAGHRGCSRRPAPAAPQVQALEARVLLSAVPAAAADETLIGESPYADAYVQDGPYADVNFGYSKQLLVKGAVGGLGYRRVTYLNINLRGVSPDVGSVKLTLHGGELPNPRDETSVTLGVYPAAVPLWDEGTLTFDNQPEYLSDEITHFTVTGTAPRYYAVDLTGYVLPLVGGGRGQHWPRHRRHRVHQRHRRLRQQPGGRPRPLGEFHREYAHPDPHPHAHASAAAPRDAHRLRHDARRDPRRGVRQLPRRLHRQRSKPEGLLQLLRLRELGRQRHVRRRRQLQRPDPRCPTWRAPTRMPPGATTPSGSPSAAPAPSPPPSPAASPSAEQAPPSIRPHRRPVLWHLFSPAPCPPRHRVARGLAPPPHRVLADSPDARSSALGRFQSQGPR